MKSKSPQKATQGTKVAEQAEMDGLLRAKQLAEKLQASVRKVRQLVADKEIPVVRLGKAVRFHYPEVLAALKKNSESENGGKESA